MVTPAAMDRTRQAPASDGVGGGGGDVLGLHRDEGAVGGHRADRHVDAGTAR